MKRAVVFALVASLASCGFAKKYPAITIGITAAVIAEGTCELGTGEHLTCAGISAGVGVGLAGIVALALLLGGPGDTVLSGVANDPDAPPPPQVPQDLTLDEPQAPVEEPQAPVEPQAPAREAPVDEAPVDEPVTVPPAGTKPPSAPPAPTP